MSFSKASVSDIMVTDVITVPPHRTVLEALEIMIRNGFDQLPVTEDNRLIGMITWQDIGHKVVLKKKDPRGITVEDVMIREPQKVTPKEGAVSAFETVIETRTGLPVVSGDKLIGLFTFHDVLAYYLKTFKEQSFR